MNRPKTAMSGAPAAPGRRPNTSVAAIATGTTNAPIVPRLQSARERAWLPVGARPHRVIASGGAE